MKSIIAYGSFLALSLGLAYARWTKPPSSLSDNEIVVMYGESKDIEKIEWKTEKDSLVMTVEEDEKGLFIWATHTQQPKKEGDEVKIKSFKAGEKGAKILDALSPLAAKRKFDTLTTEKTAEVGLDAPTNQLTITRKGKEQTLRLSEQLYSSYYAQDAEGVTYLLDANKLRNLKSARSTLPDNRLWSFKKNEITNATIGLPDGGQLKLIHENWQDRQNAQWKVETETETQDQSTDEDGNKQLVTWIGKLLRLNVKAYADESINSEDLSLKMTLVVSKDGAADETLTVFSDEKGENWYGKSDHTRKVVEIRKQSISTLIEEAPGLFSTN